MNGRTRHGEIWLAYSVDGPDHAPALLLVNSIGATRAMWDPQVKTLARHFRVIRYDARGHGESSAPAGDCTIDDLGRDALAILDDVGIGRAHVCGISLGGLTALWLGRYAPDRVDHLIVANAAARIGTTESWAERMTVVRGRGMTAVADIAMPRWLSDAFRREHPDIALALHTMIVSCPPAGYLGCCAALRDADLRDAVAAITSPVLAIAGSADVTTPPSALADIAHRIPGARMVTLDAAHLTNLEQAEAFTAAVTAFLPTPSS